MTSRLGRALTALTLLALPGCGRKEAGGLSVDAARRWAVPAADVGVDCADLTDTRVCWDASGQATRVARTVPPGAPPTPPGFRCVGLGTARTCEARDGAGPFECAGTTCTQKHPRQPDDGQWQCSDDAGVTVCVGGEPPAGVVRTDTAPGWTCSTRSDSRAGPGGARVCVDLSPDFPTGTASEQRCRWSTERGVIRTCTRDRDAHVLGDACDPTHPCVAGAVCVSERCIPARPAADCSIDSDCRAGGCRFGSCTAVRL